MQQAIEILPFLQIDAFGIKGIAMVMAMAIHYTRTALCLSDIDSGKSGLNSNDIDTSTGSEQGFFYFSNLKKTLCI